MKKKSSINHWFVEAMLFLLLMAGASCHRTNQSHSSSESSSTAYKQTANEYYLEALHYLKVTNDSIVIFVNKITSLSEAHQDTTLLIKGKLLLAHYHLKMSNYPEAMNLSLELLPLARKPYQRYLPEIYEIIGNTYKENESYEGALRAADKAVEASRMLKDTVELIGALLDKAMFTHSYSMLKNNDSIAKVSLGLYFKGLELAQSHPKFEQNEIAFLDDISQYYLLGKEYEKGIDYGKKGVYLAKKYNQISSLTYSFNWLGQIYYFQGDTALGMRYLDSALTYAQQLNWKFREAEILLSKYECYRSTGQSKEALDFFVRSRDMRDSLQMLKNLKLVSLQHTQYETAKKNQTITSLSNLNQRKVKEVWMVLIGLGLFILLSLFLGVQYRMIRRKNKQIEKNFDKINQQSDRLKVLMKELHHRVKNNLQIVSSLLSLQSSQLSDENALQAVRTGQQRIEAMSLIHRSLYKHDQPNVINLPEYITELIHCIMDSFGREETRLNLHIDVRVKELDVDTALPLGLIINEWVTNCFKYAFKGVNRPELQVSLVRKNKLILTIKDNGPGISSEIWQHPQNSFGIKLIKVLTKQLHGENEIKNTEGTSFILSIP